MSDRARRILLVEDDPNDRALTLEVLAVHGLADDTTTLGDGVEVLDYLYRRGRFEGTPPGLPVVVLLDLKMPRLDGFEVLAEIRRTPALRSLPVVILTSSAEEADIARAYGLGSNGFIVKPVDFDEFVDAIRITGQFWTEVNTPPSGARPA